MSERKRGRPRKHPDYDHDKTMQEVVDKAVSLFGEPYDDRAFRDPSAPSLNHVAKEMHTTVARVRKLLITAGCYTTETSRSIWQMYHNGIPITDIVKNTGLSVPVVYSYLPYTKGVYNLEERTVNAEAILRKKKRKRACKALAEHQDQPDEITVFWSTIEAFQDYPFTTAKGERYRYSLTTDGMQVIPFNLSIPGYVVERVYIKFRHQPQDELALRDDELYVAELFFLYPVFRRIIITDN